MTNIAILGFGTVGSGVYSVLSDCDKAPLNDVFVKRILDLRSFPAHEAGSRVTADFGEILSDGDISIVVETMGGTNPAYEFSLAAIKAGKSVVTSNKAVVDKYGRELEAAAAEHGVVYLYEASVGGGIPIIAPLRDCFSADKILRIAGILNGTTNYILTLMAEQGRSFAESLADAQAKGFAEADPTADIKGFDAARKIAILAGIAFGRYIPYESIPVIRGIDDVTAEDISLAARLGCCIKLLAVAEAAGDGVSIYVEPHLVGSTSLFRAVNGCFNAVSVTGSAVGETVFYGQGAGSLPTASAVCGDIARVINGAAAAPLRRAAEPGFVRAADGIERRCVDLPNGKSYPLF